MRFSSAIAIIVLLAAFGCGEPEPEVDETTPAVEAAPEVIDGDVDTIDLGDAEEIGAPESDPAETTVPESVATNTASNERAAPRTAPVTEPAPERTGTSTPPPSKPEPVRAEPAPAPAEPAPTPVAEEEPAAKESPSSSGSSMKRPKTHTVDNDGAMHAPGLETPEKKCAVCHGKDLQGGKAGVGCFDCHDKNWD